MWAAGGFYNVRNITFRLETTEPVPDPVTPGQINSMVLSGFVRDPSSTPIPGARIVLLYCGTLCNESLVLSTDETGRYVASFDAIPDGYSGALGWAWVEKDFLFRYELDSRFVRVTTRRATFDFILREIEWVSAEGSTNVTVNANDPLCFNDAQDPSFGSDMVCHPLRVLARETER